MENESSFKREAAYNASKAVGKSPLNNSMIIFGMNRSYGGVGNCSIKVQRGEREGVTSEVKIE